jgi:CheY-like chemotaxis protein
MKPFLMAEALRLDRAAGYLPHTVDRPARVLLVDDARGDVLLTRRWLGAGRGVDCDLVSAASVGEALETLHVTRAGGMQTDLVLLDIGLPGDSGFSLLEKIRADPAFRRIPVIMCTGSAHDVDRRYATLLGVVGYVLKPLAPATLRAIVEQLPRLSVVEGAAGVKLLAA